MLSVLCASSEQHQDFSASSIQAAHIVPPPTKRTMSYTVDMIETKSSKEMPLSISNEDSNLDSKDEDENGDAIKAAALSSEDAALAENLEEEEQSVASRGEKGVFDYGSTEFTLHELEDRLDLDLQKLENDLLSSREAKKKLSNDLRKVFKDVSELFDSISTTEVELHNALNELMNKDRWIRKHDLEEEFERLINLVHSGKVGVDYITGELQAKDTSLNGNAEAGELMMLAADASSSKNAVEKSLADLERSIETAEEVNENVHAGIGAAPFLGSSGGNVHTEFAQKMMTKLLKEVQDFKKAEDPAVMKMDILLLQDVVSLAITASLFGMMAVVLRLPVTAGFLVGGMIIGPSWLCIIQEVKQLQTLAAFGSIFILFEQGLLYSKTYSASKEARSQSESERTEESLQISRLATEYSNDHDASLVGAILLVILIFSGISFFVLSGNSNSLHEAIVLATTCAISSTPVVSDNLHAARLADSTWGKYLLKMIVSIPTIPIISFYIR